jgi:[acyl-carrier-protein] S-malonyltransferase
MADERRLTDWRRFPGKLTRRSLDSVFEPVSFRAGKTELLMKTALVFPGQGSQAVGMGKALAEEYSVARDVFARVDSALSQSLSQLMFEGPAAELTMTVNAQPALMTSSIAALRALEAEAGFNAARDAVLVAGHSLGEYSALCAAGSLTLEDAARLLRLRGEAMQRAVPVGKGAMAAIFGLDFGVVTRIATQAASDLYLTGAVCQAANDNGGGQVVISGTAAAVERAVELAKLAGAKRATTLPVSAPFHCALMQPAALAMETALKGVAIARPEPSLVANVSASAVSDPEAIRAGLVAQVTGAVRWRESVAYMSGQGVARFIELGTGRVLAGLIKRNAEGSTTLSVGTPDDIAAFMASAGR